jgi:sugar O-acyltransferase (sialic acid O-acetyltransferase NeuD family)
MGSGGFAREVMRIARSCRELQTVGANRVQFYFVERRVTTTHVNGVEVLSEEAFERLPGEKLFNVAIADSRLRQSIVGRVAQYATPVNLTAPGALQLDALTVEAGLIQCHFSTLSANARIGRFFHANFYCYVAHDCVVGDWVTFAPYACCNGNVHVGNHAYVGAHAVIRNGSSTNPLVIGEGAVIGMGAVVTKSVPPNTTVIGNPARFVDRPAQ